MEKLHCINYTNDYSSRYPITCLVPCSQLRSCCVVGLSGALARSTENARQGTCITGPEQGLQQPLILIQIAGVVIIWPWTAEKKNMGGARGALALAARRETVMLFCLPFSSPFLATAAPALKGSPLDYSAVQIRVR